MILVQGPLLGYLSNKFDKTRLILTGSFLLVVNFYLMSIGNDTIIYAAAFLYALGNGLMWPSYLTLLSRMGGDQQQGSVQGTANSAGSLASIIGLVFGGYLYGVMGSSIFLAAAIVLGVIFLMSFRMFEIDAALNSQTSDLG